MGRRVELALDRLLVGSPLRKPWVAAWVVAALIAALLISIGVILLAIGSLKAGAAGVFLEGLVFAASYGISIAGNVSHHGFLRSRSFGGR